MLKYREELEINVIEVNKLKGVNSAIRTLLKREEFSTVPYNRLLDVLIDNYPEILL